MKHMDKGSTLFLRLALVGMAGFVILLNALFLPAINRELPIELPHLSGWRYLLMFSLVASSLVFFIAIGQVMRLLSIIDHNKAFSPASVRAMRNVRYCGLAISGLFAVCMPIIFHLAEADDAPGLILIFGFIFIGIPLSIAIFAHVAEKLFQNAINIKSENDLTV